jgi:hypothetical protein
MLSVPVIAPPLRSSVGGYASEMNSTCGKCAESKNPLPRVSRL